jgi:hypothetical protein
MRIKTNIGYTGEWQIQVHTQSNDIDDSYHAFCILSNYRGELIYLTTKYILDEQTAANFHQTLCKKAKELFDL